MIKIKTGFSLSLSLSLSLPLSLSLSLFFTSAKDICQSHLEMKNEKRKKRGRRKERSSHRYQLLNTFLENMPGNIFLSFFLYPLDPRTVTMCSNLRNSQQGTRTGSPSPFNQKDRVRDGRPMCSLLTTVTSLPFEQQDGNRWTDAVCFLGIHPILLPGLVDRRCFLSRGFTSEKAEDCRKDPTALVLDSL